jgi:hypothetical protein
VVAIEHKEKNIGKPYAGKLHVRFDEEGLGPPVLHSTDSYFIPHLGMLVGGNDGTETRRHYKGVQR